MESSKSKIGINILIVIAIVLTGMSLMSAVSKKPSTLVTNPPSLPPQIETPQVQLPVVETPLPEISTTTQATTTNNINNVPTSTSTVATTTVMNVKGFTGKNWTWIRTLAGGKATLPKKPTAFTISFNVDGTIKGTTDCNNFFGHYTITGNVLTLEKLGATQMFCEGSQEGEFMNSLQEITNYMVDKSNNLILVTKIGTSTMMFR